MQSKKSSGGINRDVAVTNRNPFSEKCGTVGLSGQFIKPFLLHCIKWKKPFPFLFCWSNTDAAQISFIFSSIIHCSINFGQTFQLASVYLVINSYLCFWHFFACSCLEDASKTPSEKTDRQIHVALFIYLFIFLSQPPFKPTQLESKVLTNFMLSLTLMCCKLKLTLQKHNSVNDMSPISDAEALVIRRPSGHFLLVFV